MMKKTITAALIFTLFFMSNSFANNVQISNIQTPNNETITFDISWDNSWRVTAAPSNWDAVWVFVKFQDCADVDKTWLHADLSDNNALHTATGGLTVDGVPDRKGAFVYRSADGSGTVSGTVTLTFNTPFANAAANNYQVFGIEMVNIPQGNFWIGDATNLGVPSASPSIGSFGDNGDFVPRLVTSQTTSLNGGNTNSPVRHFTWNTVHDDYYGRRNNSSMPKGVDRFYCMKYEISQGQYAAFLNTLTYDQQISRIRSAITPESPAGTLALTTPGNENRNGVRIQTPGDDATKEPAIFDVDLNGDGTFGDGENIACNYLAWQDLLAYLDWSALRPMTESEFEKACRGPQSQYPVQGEFAWGTTDLTQATSAALNNAGTATETSTASGNGLSAYGGASTGGPIRVGFAATASTITRQQAGASYYGVLDLSGNLWEQTIHFGRGNEPQATMFPSNLNTSHPFRQSGTNAAAAAVGFQLHGDGALNINGNSNLPAWPDSSIPGIVILRGGAYDEPAQRMQVSDRERSTTSVYPGTQRNANFGGRGVRNAL
jgi:formylglycine-generating enzyme required for sulfatase activity